MLDDGVLGAEREQLIAHRDEPAADCRVYDVDRRELAGLAGARSDFAHRVHHVLERRVDRLAAAPGDRKIRRPEENAIDARRVQDAVECLDRRARLDHGERNGVGVAVPQPLGMRGLSVARKTVGRSPGSFADRRILHRGGKALGILHRVHHRRDDRLCAEIERAARHVEAADGNPHQRRLAGTQHRRQAAQHAVLVVSAMLHVQRHGVKVLGRHDLHSERVGNARPRRVERLPSRQPRNQGHVFLPLVAAIIGRKIHNNAKKNRPEAGRSGLLGLAGLSRR